VITSKKRKVKFTNPETGIEESYSVLIWNPTIANLTLMALGSSAPEILLSCIETTQNLGQPPGELGPSTIVGSAAFNLLVISAISVVSPKRGETKKVYDLGVFAITAISSLFAYIWLYICLEVWSKGVVSIWEAVITFLFFVILIISAYAADRINWLIKKIKNRKLGKTTHQGQFDVDDFIFVLNSKPEDMPKDEKKNPKHQAIQKFYKEHFGDRDPATLTREEIEEKL
jgi:solute carrier family 8 (sodium/calcium exchanger)